MCVVSMIMDHYYNEWQLKYPMPTPSYLPPVKMPSQEEIEEFHRLLERAREYDKKNNEPDCELEEKKKKLLDLAEELGVEISFL